MSRSSRKMSIKSTITRGFKLNGLSIRVDAAKALASALLREEDVEAALGVVIQAIKNKVERQDLKSTLIDLDAITAVVSDLTKDEDDVVEERIQFVDAFQMPVLHYHQVRKHFYLDSEKRPLHGDPELKATMFRERFALIHQRVLRNKAFAKPLLGGSSREYIELTPLDSLLGSSGQKCLHPNICLQTYLLPILHFFSHE